MCTPARRLWLPAILTLTLGLVQGRACGQEGIGTAVTAAMGHMAKRRSALPPLSAPASAPRVALFAWEKDDPAERQYNLGRFDELVGDNEEAYIHFRGLSRDHAAERRYSEATKRVKGAALVDLTEKGLIGDRSCWDCRNPRLRKRDIEEWEAENWRLTDIAHPPTPAKTDLWPDTELCRWLMDVGVITDASPPEADPEKDRAAKGSNQRLFEGFGHGAATRF